MSSLAIVVLSLIIVVDGAIKIQCECDTYLPCSEKHKDKSFKHCIKRCKREVFQGSVFPTQYEACLNDFDHPLTKLMECTNGKTGNGCAGDAGRVISDPAFSNFEEKMYDRVADVVEKVGVSFEYKTKRMARFHTCLLYCVYPTVNKCTRKLNCGLLAPSDDQMVNNIMECAERTDVTKGILLEMATCMRQVVHTIEPPPLMTTTELAEEPSTMDESGEEEEEENDVEDGVDEKKEVLPDGEFVERA